MLKLASDPEVTAKVVIGGVPIDWRFKVLPDREIKALLDDAARRGRARPLVRVLCALGHKILRGWAPEHWAPKDDTDYLLRFTLGWGEDQVDLPFSESSMRTLCERYPDAPRLLLEAWVVALQEGRRKNS